MEEERRGRGRWVDFEGVGAEEETVFFRRERLEPIAEERSVMTEWRRR